MNKCESFDGGLGVHLGEGSDGETGDTPTEELRHRWTNVRGAQNEWRGADIGEGGGCIVQ